jgi:hypothetical protein
MVDAVALFALCSALFEAVILLKLPLRMRLRILGSSTAVGVIHTLIILANLAIHFGTITGTMTAVLSGLMSFLTVPAVRWYGGCIRNRQYFPGVRVYNTQLLR